MVEILEKFSELLYKHLDKIPGEVLEGFLGRSLENPAGVSAENAETVTGGLSETNFKKFLQKALKKFLKFLHSAHILKGNYGVLPETSLEILP